ncbi:MAG TPA: peptidoglycan bridge formation glycyltransferase FemA/FemB family protein [Candidatus Paceibacterota bacterium]|nr:peptidoglycan bridge formation glycyltransferase FemA/FemB family protein [Candidatus Pacearchaeota archaeon]HRZ51149.1 peptidoglycan bridge formation glycyltransferase FemA/FemB family protein [Candidatus Paceibacterota bacterium]HSA36844.1 peptidoglycan bridge formation glycyltransferase FemA/FemB family protein [Candidatus Paceibacterota bacterium]
MIKNITEKAEWENFLDQCREKSFLNSWSWGEFQESRGFTIWRLGFQSNSQLQAVALAVKIKARRGTFLLIQHGPNVLENSTQKLRLAMESIMAELAAIAKKEGAIFIRINPLWERSGENNELLETMGFRLSPMHANAYEATWRLDISLSEEDLLKGMRKTTRYLIKQAQKNSDIAIIKSERLQDADIFEKLSREVATRQKFSPFSRRFTKKEFEIFSRDGQALWFFGKIKEEYAAAALVIFWRGTAYYHQAASLAKYAKLSIPYLLQWEAVKEAKKRGCRWYDFWGYTDPKANPDHPWAGPTLFKMGFGGQKSEYVLTRDYPLSLFYWPVYFFEKIRKAKRNL